MDIVILALGIVATSPVMAICAYLIWRVLR